MKLANFLKVSAVLILFVFIVLLSSVANGQASKSLDVNVQVSGEVNCNGNNICEPNLGETEINCPDECGCNNNGLCEVNRGESAQTCPHDCGGGGGFSSHNECNAQKQCISVLGFGISQCNTSNDCATHNECNAQNRCILISGVGFNQCQINSDCITIHNECNGFLQCVAINGSGINQCQINSDCQILKHNECNSQKQCVVVDGAGNDLCQTNADCNITHNECNLNNQCIAVGGVGLNQCQSNNNCKPTKHNECNGFQQCVVIDGVGSNKCQTSADCSSPGTGGGIIAEHHTECNNSLQCISVPGSGGDQCQASNDCASAGVIKKVIKSPVGLVTTKIISTTGLVVAIVVMAIPLLRFSLFEIFLILLRLLGLLLIAFGLKKRVRPWGIVYDSVTEKPIYPAYVTLKNSKGEKISSAITDSDGRYGFLTEPGVYQMSASKTNYIFPSQKLAGKNHDELHENLYFGENIEVKKSGEAIIKNIPLDYVKFNWNEFTKWGVVLRKIGNYFFTIGFIVAIIAYIFSPHPYNTVIIILYIFLLLLRIFGWRRSFKKIKIS